MYRRSMYLNFGNGMEKWSPDSFSVMISFGIGNFVSLKSKMYLEAMLTSSSEKNRTLFQAKYSYGLFSLVSFANRYCNETKTWTCIFFWYLVFHMCHQAHFVDLSGFSLFQNTRWTWKHTVCYETFTPPTQDLFRQILLHNFP